MILSIPAAPYLQPALKLATTMLHTIQSFSQRRVSWFLLAVTAILLECFALFMQHVMGVEPCNECIYVRVAVLGMALAGLVGAIAPGVRVMRWGALAAWFAALGWGLWRAALLLDLEQKVKAGAEASCGRFKGFPEWMPLERWAPDVFEPRAMCGAVSWTFLNQSVTFWIWAALWGIAAIAVLVLVAQFRSPK